MTLILEFPINPEPKGRPRMTRRGRVYTPRKTVLFERQIQAIAQSQYKKDPLTGPLSVHVEFHFARPKSVKREFHTVKPDIDNLQKAILDALNGIIWIDDAQIICLTSSKSYSIEPRIILKVT